MKNHYIIFIILCLILQRMHAMPPALEDHQSAGIQATPLKGPLTETKLLYWLEKNNPFNKDVSSSLSVEKLPGVSGRAAEAIFKVYCAFPNGSVHSPFIIKIMRDKNEKKDPLKEIKNLNKITISFKPLKPDMPRLAVHEGFYSYHQDGVTRYFQVLHAARGQTYESILRAALESMSSSDLTKLEDAYGRLGTVLANFQLCYMKNRGNIETFKAGDFIRPYVTRGHGDLNFFNVFFSPCGRVTFIDNEGLGSGEDAHIIEDACYSMTSCWVYHLRDFFKDVSYENFESCMRRIENKFVYHHLKVYYQLNPDFARAIALIWAHSMAVSWDSFLEYKSLEKHPSSPSVKKFLSRDNQWASFFLPALNALGEELKKAS